MANYESRARTNYFKVKSEKAFRAWAEKLGFTVIAKAKLGLGLMAERGFDYIDETAADEGDFDIVTELARHLAEGEVAVIYTIGSEKMRYLAGYAEAVNHLGKSVLITLDDIYAVALKEFNVRPSRAEY